MAASASPPLATAVPPEIDFDSESKFSENLDGCVASMLQKALGIDQNSSQFYVIKETLLKIVSKGNISGPLFRQHKPQLSVWVL